jgi:excisionase family DNA binding protein
MKRVLTTGDVARLCHVTINTVVKWAETGELKGFKIPGSGARRFTREEVIGFMKKYNFPIDEMVAAKTRILVVDDEPEICEIFKQAFLSAEGFEVVEAGSGFEAGLIARKFYPDLILLDIKLGDIDGREVCRLIKEDKSLSKTKIIAVSGAISDAEARQLKSQGFSDYIKKPFKIEKMKKKVLRHLR